jgi:hypothetical protein
MYTVILNHRVKDFDFWKKHYDADLPRRDAAGLRQLKLGLKSDDPSNVFIIWEASNPDGIQKMVKDPDLKRVMQDAGVISEPEVTILKDGLQ